jgi:succinate dehydrogenase/fumarate reductase flavoprotein subunit
MEREMDQEKHGIDRRSFLRHAALVGGGVGAAGLLAACSPSQPAAPTASEGAAVSATTTPAATGGEFPTTETFDFSGLFTMPEAGPVAFVAEPISTADIKSEVETEVLVLGAGIAGVCVAASAAENGLKVTILEKGEAVAFRGYDICAWGDKVHKAAGLTATTPEELVKALIDLSEWRADYLLFQTWAYNCNDAVDWLIDKVDGKAGEPFIPWSHGNVDMVDTKWYGTAVKFPGEMAQVVPAMLEYAQSNGTEILFNTPAVQLVKDGDAITGAIAKSDDGYVKYTASKGVVLCTGSYDRNPERLKKYLRPRDLTAGNWFNTTATDTGDGHEMGLAVGGIEDEYPHTLMTGTTQYIGMLRVNSSGDRFAPEYISATLLLNCIQNQLGAFDWIISDNNGLQALNNTRGDYSSLTAEEQFAAFAETGESADTIEDLAAKIDVPADRLKATIDRYNALCTQGADDDYNVPQKCLNPIDTPPFYAMRETVRMLTTVSGLRITAKSEVINKDSHEPIPGLYAIGNVSGGMFAGSYAHNVSGVSHSRCITYGYLLGKRLAGVI